MWGSPRRQRLDLSLPPSFHPSRVSPFLFLSPFPLSPPAPSQCFSICDNNAMSFKELLQQVTLKIVFAFSIHFFPITMFFSWYVSGFPTGSAVKNPPANAGDMAGAVGLTPVSGRFPWRRKWQPTPVFLPGKSHGQRSLVGYSPWGHKELDTTEQLNNCNRK